MRLDAFNIRFYTKDEWRVLQTVDFLTKNREVVSAQDIAHHSKAGNVKFVEQTLWSLESPGKLVHHKVYGKKRDHSGFGLTYGGLDYLALYSHAQAGSIYSVGNQIGSGKESDVVVVADKDGHQHVLKLHRLGRTSFRSVRNNRDYARKGQHYQDFKHMSTLAAKKEYAFMLKLWEVGFPVPRPMGQNRHTVLMEFVDAFPLRQIDSVPDPAELYGELIELVLRLARHGLIHGDFNEFNILVREDPLAKSAVARREGTEGETEAVEKGVKLTPIVIDFPQMVSMSHTNAEEYFERDVNAIKKFFERRYGFTSDEPGPFFRETKKIVGSGGARLLDVEAYASGFPRKMAQELETFLEKRDSHGRKSTLDELDGSEARLADSEDEPNSEVEDDEDESEMEHNAQGGPTSQEYITQKIESV